MLTLAITTEESLIDFRELIGQHSGENMAAAIWETVEMSGLLGRVSLLHVLIKIFVERPGI